MLRDSNISCMDSMANPIAFSKFESKIIHLKLSSYEWIKKSWYINTVEYYSAIKRKEFESVELRWMNLESIIQSEVSQK